jgi:cobalamin synthase
MSDKWALYLIVSVLGLVVGVYVVVGIVSWIFKVLLVLFFILFVFVVLKLRRSSRRRRGIPGDLSGRQK